LMEKLKENEFLIVAHRGSSKGNILGNTTISTKIAFYEGADIVEMDVLRSKDGKFYSFHDGAEEYLTYGENNFLKMSSLEIENTKTLNSLNAISGDKVKHFQKY